MKLILHIGTEKTGTTSIQRFLHINRNVFNSQGILIPKTIAVNNGNHRWLPAFVYDDNFEDKFTKTYCQNNKSLRKNLIEKKLKEFKKEVSNSSANICIISSEHLSSRLRKIENIKKLKELLSSLFDEISIILYIRRPMELSISMLSTIIKVGDCVDGINLIKCSKNSNNLKIIRNWENVFSKKNLKIKLFDRNEFIEGDLIKDFCHGCDIAISSKFTIPKKKNETLNLNQMKYLNYLNQYFPKFINERVNEKRGDLTGFIMKNFKSSDYLLPTTKEYQLFEEHFSDDNNYIKKEYFPDKKQLWSTYTKGFGEKDNVISELSGKEIEFLDAIKELWLQRKLYKSNLLKKFFNKLKKLLFLNRYP